MSNIAKTIQIDDRVSIRIEHDEDAESPAEWGSSLGQITYNARSRYVLGTEGIDSDRFDEIERKVASGEYIGIPVYAHVHGGSTIRAGHSNPFHCQWDSGRSGWAYCTREKAIAEFGNKVMTKKVREAALKCLIGEVETFDQYTRGEVYGFEVVVEGEVVDSCWGIYGFDDAEAEARQSAQYAAATA